MTTSNLGPLLIWTSLLYVVIAIFAAKRTYRQALRANPAYFSPRGGLRSDPFKVEEASGVFKLVMDRSIQDGGFTPSLIKRIRRVQFLYFTVPLAFILFFVGIIIR